MVLNKALISVAFLAVCSQGAWPGLWLRAKAGPTHSLARDDGWSSGKIRNRQSWLGDFTGLGRTGEAQAGLLFPPDAKTRLSFLLYGHLAMKEAEIGEDWAPVLGRRFRTLSSGGGLGLARACGPARSWYAQAGISYLLPRAAFEADSFRVVPGYAPAFGFRAGIGGEARPFRAAPGMGLGLAVDFDQYVVERRSARIFMRDGVQTRLQPSGDRELLEYGFSLQLTLGYAFRVL